MCQIVNEQEHRAGTRTHVTALRVRYPCRWTTSAFLSVGSEGLEPSPGGLRVRCAAASTLIPISRRGGSRTLDLTLIRGLLSPLSYAPANRAGGTRTPGTDAQRWSAGLKVRCAAGYTTTLCLVGRMCFNRVNIVPRPRIVPNGSPENRTQRHLFIRQVRATSPRLPLPTSLSNQSGWQDSK